MRTGAVKLLGYSSQGAIGFRALDPQGGSAFDGKPRTRMSPTIRGGNYPALPVRNITAARPAPDVSRCAIGYDALQVHWCSSHQGGPLWTRQ